MVTSPRINCNLLQASRGGPGQRLGGRLQALSGFVHGIARQGGAQRAIRWASPSPFPGHFVEMASPYPGHFVEVAPRVQCAGHRGGVYDRC